MDGPILLLGPVHSGKTTVGKRLAERLDRPYLHVGELMPSYAAEIGFDEAKRGELGESGGFEAVFHYEMPFQAHALERAIADHRDAVLELSVHQSLFDDPEILQRAVRAVGAAADSIRLLPAHGFEEAVRILEERGYVYIDGMEINEHFVKHPSNRTLAKLTVYTNGRTPEETMDEILERRDPAASEIILIGPMGAGKSTLGPLLSKRLGVPQAALDSRRFDYYREIGWDEETQREINAREGFRGVYRYWKRFELYSVGRLLADNRECVIDFGAGHSVYEDPTHFARARELLAPYPNVVLLLPSPDPDESVAALRTRHRPRIGGVELTRFCMTHSSQAALARRTLYTEGRTPDQIVDEIVAGMPEALDAVRTTEPRPA